MKDLTGKRNGKLTIIAFSHKTGTNKERNLQYYWRCKCDCGNEIVVHKSNFPRTHSCGCTKTGRGKNSLRFSGCEEIPGSYICKKHYDAKRRGLDFLVSPEYLWELFLKQNRVCALSNLPIVFAKFQGDYTATASLDRINSSKGYVEGNVQWVHKDINWMKQDFDQSHFIDLCKMITECQNKSSLV